MNIKTYGTQHPIRRYIRSIKRKGYIIIHATEQLPPRHEEEW